MSARNATIRMIGLAGALFLLGPVAVAHGQDCNDNGIPDNCDISCGCPFFFCCSILGCGQSEDCNANGIPDECEDCNNNGIPDPCDVTPPLLCNPFQPCLMSCGGCGASADCGPNGVPDECDPDDDDDGVPDDCDLCPGADDNLDCDEDGIPDACDKGPPAILQVPADHSTIQAAIDAACDGDEIIVAPGTYEELIDFLGRSITIRSTDPGDPVVVSNTVIDASDVFLLPFKHPVSVDLDAANNRALVVDPVSDALLGVDLVTGDRTIISDDNTGAGPPFISPQSVALDAANNRALVVDTLLDALLAVDLTTGNRTILSDVSNGTGPNFETPVSVALDAANNRALVVDNTSNFTTRALLAVDLTTGNRTVIVQNNSGPGPQWEVPVSVALDSVNNRALVVDSWDDELFTVVFNSGSRFVLADGIQDPVSVAVDAANNRALVITLRSRLWGVDLDTGVKTVLSDSTSEGPLFDFSQSIAMDAANNRALVADVGLDALLGVDLATGARSLISHSFGSVVTCNSGEGFGAILSGLTITSGSGSFLSLLPVGGGMLIDGSSPTVTDCEFSGNTAHEGGGVYINDGSPTIDQCTFSGNVAERRGGAMFNGSNSNSTVTNCAFIGNISSSGGGIYNAGGSVMIEDCTFSWNDAWAGGGMFNAFSSDPAVTGCIFISNSADLGGGMYNAFFSSPTVTNSTFSGNRANANGGGIYNNESSPTVTNCTFSGNFSSKGGGMYNGGASPTLSNCVLWHDLPDEIINIGSSTTVQFCDIEGSGGSGAGWDAFLGTDLGGNIDADPKFQDPDGADDIHGTEDDDLRLLPGSPCIDAANNLAVPPDTLDLDGDGDTTEPIPFDLDGNPRLHDDTGLPDCWQAPGQCGDPPVVDMGAYEFQGTSVPPCPADLDGDGQVRVPDLIILLGAWGPNPGHPADLDGNGEVRVPDLIILLGAWGICE